VKLVALDSFGTGSFGEEHFCSLLHSYICWIHAYVCVW